VSTKEGEGGPKKKKKEYQEKSPALEGGKSFFRGTRGGRHGRYIREEGPTKGLIKEKYNSIKKKEGTW